MNKRHPEAQDDILAEQPEKNGPTPLRLFLIGIIGIVLAEGIVMVAVHTIKPKSYWWDSLIDGLALGLIIFPIFYYFAYKVFPAQVAKRRRTETVLRKVLESLPIGVWILNREGKVQHGNLAARNLWAGFQKVDIEGYSQYKAWWPETGKPVKPEEWAAVRAMQKGEAILNEEVEIESFDGNRKIILNSASPFFDDKGALQGVVVVNHDITQRRTLEKKLIEYYELLERYFSSIDTLIAYMDRDFNFIRVNDSYARSAGHPPEFFIGKNHFELYPHEENQAIFQRVVETGEPFVVQEKPFEYPEFPERGVTYWNWALQPVRGPDGRVQGVVLSLVDVTERKRAELKLEEQNKELRILSDAERNLRKLAEGLVGASIAVTSSLDLEEVLDQIIFSLQRIISFRTANVLLLDNDQFRVVHHWCTYVNPDHGQDFRAQYPIDRLPQFQEVYQTKRVLLIPRTSQRQDWIEMAGMEWVASYLAAPLIAGGELIGIIDLSCDADQEFTEEMAQYLMAFAAPAAVAIHNARLYAAEQRARQVAETLNSASVALARSLEIDEVLNSLLDYTARLVTYDYGCVLLLDDEFRLTVRALKERSNDEKPQLVLNEQIEVWDDPFLNLAVTSKNTLLIADTAAHPDWINGRRWNRVRSWLAIPMINNEKTVGLVVFTRSAPEPFSQEHVNLAEAIVAQAAVAAQNAWLFEQVRSGHERLQTLYRRLVDVQENERRYIAAELHDDTSQALAATMIRLRLLEQDPDLPESVRVQIKKVKEVIDKVLENLHRLAVNLRPATLDLLGLVATIEQLINEFKDHSDLDIHFKTSGICAETRLPSELEITIYRIVQEALNNVARHAHTSNVDVILELRDNKVVAVVEDDGVGYDPDNAGASGHLGLIGMQERAEIAGGSIHIESEPGKGTTVVVEIPYGD